MSPHKNWKKLPGGFDALNTMHIYPSDNAFGIPTVPHAPLSAVPERFVVYRTRRKDPSDAEKTAVHFFTDDYRFESIWRRPVQTLSGIQKWAVALTPDFSLYYDLPLALQIWNTYRTRWVGCWWAANGITVIPTVSWGNYQSYDFCYLGLPERSVLAVSTVGIKKDATYKMPFMNGFKEMVTRLQPTLVLNYGTPYDEMRDLVDIKAYPDYWHSGRRKTARKYGKQDDYDQKQRGTSDLDKFDLDY